MRINFKLGLIVLLLILGYYAHAKEAQSENYLKYLKKPSSPTYITYVNEIVEDFVRYMEQKYQLHCHGSGGNMPKDVEKIKVLFTSYKKSTIDDARKMEIDAIQELLKRINAHEKIRPYLREYPFGLDRVGVTISFRTETDEHPLDGSIALVYFVKQKIFYEIAEIQIEEPTPLAYMNEKNEIVERLIGGGPTEELITILEETYEEALENLKKTPEQKTKKETKIEQSHKTAL